MSILHLDTKFLNLVSDKLEKFSKSKDNLWLCRCPICGDSKKDQTKRRFYFFVRDDILLTKCHNCDWSSSFYKFLEHFDINTFRDYKIEYLKERGFKQKNVRKIKIKKEDRKITLPNVKVDTSTILPMVNLPNDHFAKKYLIDRLIPIEYINKLLYTDEFREISRMLNVESGEKIRKNDKRIVIPFYNKRNEIFAIQGRTMTNSDLKYITIKVHDDLEKVYGMNNIDHKKPIRVVEGPFDSMFVLNCVATCDATLYSFKQGNIYIWDDQPRNKEVCKCIDKAIKMGKKVLMWDNCKYKGKDINEKVLNGMPLEYLENYIDNNGVYGASAVFRFNNWKHI